MEFYTNAAKIIEKILKKQGCPKSLVINNKDVKNKKKLYALVCEALKYKSVTENIIEDSRLLSREKQLKPSMALVLLYDFLFGKGLQIGGKYKQMITRNKTSLQASLAKMKVKAKVMRNEDLLPASVRDHEENKMPRYVRVNTLKISKSDAVDWFSNNGFELIDLETTGSGVKLTNLASNQFTIDSHIPNLLAFSPGTDLHDNILYLEGKVILQDKASCFPAFVLNPPPGSCVIDACAAPGNKTSHLAAIMRNEGKIVAFDVSTKRIATMEKLLHRAGEQIVEVKNDDFLKSDPGDHSNIEYILVDPSCSGSGMVNRLDYVTSDGNKMDSKEEKRIKSLAQFQAAALSHALSFPAVKKVVYSTCSIHEKENEEVVRIVLERFQEKFELSNALPTWPYRAQPLFPEASKCVRASPHKGSTSGFFLALFERRKTTKADQTEVHAASKGECVLNGEKKKKSKRRKRKHKQITAKEHDCNSDFGREEKRQKLEETEKNTDFQTTGKSHGKKKKK